MRRNALPVLLVLNIAMLAAILWAWVSPSGQWRNTEWQAPPPVKLNLKELLPSLPGPGQQDTSLFLRMLERPLFSITRRPPPPPPPPKAQTVEAVNWLDQAKLTGVYEGASSGGIIIFYEGKDRRVPLNGLLDGWKLRSVSGRQATFEKDGQTKVVALQRAGLTTYTGAPQPRPPVQPAAAGSGRDMPLLSPGSGAGAVPGAAPGGGSSPAPENRSRAVFGGSR